MMFGQNSRKHVEIGGYKLNPGLRGKCTLQNPGLTTHTHTDRNRDGGRDYEGREGGCRPTEMCGWENE